MSTTVTSNTAAAELPWASVAVQWTFVTPSGKTLPESGEQPTGSGPSTLSTAVGDT